MENKYDSFALRSSKNNTTLCISSKDCFKMHMIVNETILHCVGHLRLHFHCLDLSVNLNCSFLKTGMNVEQK